MSESLVDRHLSAGYLPTHDALDLAGIDVSPQEMHELLAVTQIAANRLQTNSPLSVFPS